MANVKHIYTGAGDPNYLALDQTTGIHHYYDEVAGGLWMSRPDGAWALINAGGSEGSISFYDESANNAPQIDPQGPALAYAKNGLYIYMAGNWQKLSTLLDPEPV